MKKFICLSLLTLALTASAQAQQEKGVDQQTDRIRDEGRGRRRCPSCRR